MPSGLRPLVVSTRSAGAARAWLLPNWQGWGQVGRLRPRYPTVRTDAPTANATTAELQVNCLKFMISRLCG